MRPIQVATAIRDSLRTGRPLFLHGPPGVGKSDVVAQVAAEEGRTRPFGFIDVRAPLLDTTDTRGIPWPIPEKNQCIWFAPSFLPTIQRDDLPDEGIFFLDELNAAERQIQATLYQPILNHMIGEHVLKPGWLIMAAGNRQEDLAVVHAMSSALANRFIHIQFEVGLHDWSQWALRHDIWDAVISYNEARGGVVLNAYNPKVDRYGGPTPRTWAVVSSLKESPMEIRSELIAGAIGEGHAAEFLAYLEIYRDFPDIQAILDGDDKVPKGRDLQFAVITALVAVAEPRHVDWLITYSLRYEPELATVMVRMLKDRHTDTLSRAPSLDGWLRRYGKYLT